MSVTIKEVCDRVHAGRRQLRRLHIDPMMENIEIMIGPYAWADLLDEYKRLREEEDGYTLYRLAGPISEPTPNEFRIFGIRARRSTDLGPNEIRFRSEVSL